MHRVTTEEPTLVELFDELWEETRTLVSQEVELARNEVTEKASEAGKSVAFLAAGGFVLYAAFLGIMAAAIVGLGNLIPMWVSALIVALIVGVVGFLLVQKGRSGLKPKNLTPHETMTSVKETTEWAKNQTR